MELSQVFASSEQNSKIFTGVDGSVHALCSFLTGGDSSLQLETAYCIGKGFDVFVFHIMIATYRFFKFIANLALWEDEAKSSSLAGSTGAYLITFLGSGNNDLIEACCWGMYFVEINWLHSNMKY